MTQQKEKKWKIRVRKREMKAILPGEQQDAKKKKKGCHFLLPLPPPLPVLGLTALLVYHSGSPPSLFSFAHWMVATDWGRLVEEHRVPSMQHVGHTSWGLPWSDVEIQRKYENRS